MDGELLLAIAVILVCMIGAFFFAFGVGNRMGNAEDDLEKAKKERHVKKQAEQEN